MDFSSSCFCYSHISLKMNCRAPALMSKLSRRNQPTSYTFIDNKSDIVNQRVAEFGSKGANFVGGSRVIIQLNLQIILPQRKSSRVTACFPSSEIASIVFTLGTAAVLPFYTLMVVAPKAKLLPGITKVFSNEMTLASAWIHLLAVDLFAARQVYHDGLQNDIETRHSVSLCLLFCPVGIVTHFITKALTSSPEKRQHRTH